MTPYADLAHEYLRKGYAPLPLPAKAKKSPPSKWTGANAPWPSGADVQSWAEEQPDGNIALRMPPNVVVIDVDNYGDKDAEATMTAAIKALGPLPVIGRSSSRADDPLSGHRLFRLPEGHEAPLVGNLAGLFGPGVDIIQAHHRYIVAPGSVHPEGGVYTWYDAQGQPGEFPAVHELPYLPQRWVEGLTKTVRQYDAEATSTAYDDMTPKRQAQIDKYMASTLQAIWAEFDDMKTWPEGREDEKGGWEEGVLSRTARLARLVGASWNNLTPSEVIEGLEKHCPVSKDFPLKASVSKFMRGLDGHLGAADEPSERDEDPFGDGIFVVEPPANVERPQEVVEAQAGLIARPLTAAAERLGEVPDFLRPLQPFNEADDWDTTRVICWFDKQSERQVWQRPEGGELARSASIDNRVGILVDSAENAHLALAHETGSHPWCVPCEVRALGHDLNEDERENVEARCRGYFVRTGARQAPEVHPLPPSPPGPTFLSLDDLAALPAASWLVPGVLPAGSYGIVRGRDNEGKSLLVQDMVLEVATRAFKNWDKGAEMNGGVLYCQGEGARSTLDRIDAWIENHPTVERADIASVFGLGRRCPNLFTRDETYLEMLELVNQTKPSIIVIDTLNRAIAGADQNSAGDASIVRANVEQLKDAGAPDCTVIIVAHTDKSNRDSRGSSAFEDDADFVLAVSKKENVVTAEVTKQRDGGTGRRFHLALTPTEWGTSVYLAAMEPGAVSSQTLTEEEAGNSLRSKIQGALHGAVEPMSAGTIKDLVGDPAHVRTYRRHLATLVKDGKARRFGADGSTALYQEIDDGHLHEHPNQTDERLGRE